MRNTDEKNLKRWLKRKVKVTLGMMVAFMITGTISFSQDSIIVEGENNTQIITEKDLNINKNNDMAISVTDGGKVEIQSENINISREGGTNQSAGTPCVHVSSIKLNEGKKNGGTLILGGKETKNINITSNATTGWAMGIKVRDELPTNNSENKKSYLEINSKNLTITTHSDGYYSTGILVQNTTTKSEEDTRAHLVINSENTVINVTSNMKNEKEASSIGIAAFSQAKVEVNGNLEINAENVIETRGGATTIINKDEKNTVKLNGDIVFSYNDKTSQTTRDANVIINLSNSDSYFNGNIMKTSDIENIPEEKDKVTGMQLGLSNGAQWTTDANSFVNKLTFNDGIININGGNGHTVQIDEIVGNGGTVNIKTSVTDNGFDAGIFNIDKATEGTSLDVNFTGITADDIANDINGNLGKLSGNITGEGIKSIDTTVRVEEGLTEGAITGNLGENGELNTSTIKQNKTTTTMDGLQALSTNMYIAWKQEMNSLNKRMGELRNSTGNEGVWARVYAGESEYNKGYENKYQTYQVGYDKKYSTDNGTGFVGYLVSYTQGDTDYSHNSYVTGDNTAVGGGIYGTWLGNNGDYVDVIFKVSRLENKYDVTSLSGINSSGDYHTFGMSLSTEYGRRFNLTKGFFIEPSVEMSLGRLGAEDYRTSSGLNVEQDTIYTAEGRVGTALGYNFDKGNVYVRVAGVKEFAGELDTTINGKTITEDLGDSWIEYGIGANYRVLENLNLYVDFERTGSAEVQTNWQGNLGFRYEF